MSPESFAKMLRRLPADQASDEFESAKDEMAKLFRLAQEDNFIREQDASGRTWARRTRDYPWLTLRKTLKMMKAASIKGAAGNFEEIQHRRLTLGIDGYEVFYAKFHQFGTRRMPARQFLYLRSDDRLGLRGPLRRRLGVILQNRKRMHANG
jgi:phage gpG-like protein